MGAYRDILGGYEFLRFGRRDDGLPGRWQQPDGRHDRRRCRCGFPGAGEVIFLSIA